MLLPLIVLLLGADRPPQLVSAAASSALQPSNGASGSPRGSEGLAYLVFDSFASNLVGNDQNDFQDVFFLDPVTGLSIISKSGDQPGNGNSSAPDISADGHWVVFVSAADNLVSGDTNGVEDLFLFRYGAGVVRRLTPPGAQPNGRSYAPRMSAAGQRIVFLSEASNWVAGDQNNMVDAFVYDLQADTVSRVSRTSAGDEVTDLPVLNAGISWDGRCVSIETQSSQYSSNDNDPYVDYFVVDLAGPAAPWLASTNPTGEEFSAITTNLHALIGCNDLVFRVPFDQGSNGQLQAGFYRNRSGILTRLPLDPPSLTGTITMAVSRNARYLVAGSDLPTASGIEQTRVDLISGASTSTSSRFGLPYAVSDDGAEVLVATMKPALDMDRNAAADVVLFGSTPASVWVSRPSPDLPAVQAANGPSSFGTGVYRADRAARRRHHAISGDGRYVLFSSMASNLVADDTNNVEDVFLRDRWQNQTRRVNLHNGATQFTKESAAADLSSDARVVVFESCESIAGVPASNVCHIYAYDQQLQTTELIDSNNSGGAGNAGGTAAGMWPRISGDGRYVVFNSTASNLVAGQTSSSHKVFLRDRKLRTTTFLGTGIRPSISRNGRFVVWSYSSQFGIMLWDRETEAATAVAFWPRGQVPEFAAADYPSISDSGQFIAYSSAIDGLVDGDVDGSPDVFVYDRVAERNVQISGSSGAAALADSGILASISPSGRLVAYIAESSQGIPFQMGVLVDWQTGASRQFVDSEKYRPDGNMASRPRFSDNETTLVFSASLLHDSQLDQTGPMFDVYTTNTNVAFIHRDGFEGADE